MINIETHTLIRTVSRWYFLFPHMCTAQEDSSRTWPRICGWIKEHISYTDKKIFCLKKKENLWCRTWDIGYLYSAPVLAAYASLYLQEILHRVFKKQFKIWKYTTHTKRNKPILYFLLYWNSQILQNILWKYVDNHAMKNIVCHKIIGYRIQTFFSFGIHI